MKVKTPPRQRIEKNKLTDKRARIKRRTSTHTNTNKKERKETNPGNIIQKRKKK